MVNGISTSPDVRSLWLCENRFRLQDQVLAKLGGRMLVLGNSLNETSSWKNFLDLGEDIARKLSNFLDRAELRDVSASCSQSGLSFID